jgi:hypothetical protein
MDRAELDRRLRQAKAHVAIDNVRVDRQRALVFRFEQVGGDTELANRLLQSFLELQEFDIAEVDRLTAELAKLQKVRRAKAFQSTEARPQTPSVAAGSCPLPALRGSLTRGQPLPISAR